MVAVPLELLSLALAGFGAALGLFFAAALYLSRAVQPANLFLAGFCACFAALMIWDVVIVLFQARTPAWLGNVMDWAFLLLAPLFYFYVRRLTSAQAVGRREFMLSLLPAAASLVWVSLQIAAGGNPTSQADFMPAGYTYTYLLVAIVQLTGYCAAAYRLVRAHAQRAEHTYSSLQGADLRWLQGMMLGAGLAALAWIISAFVRNPLAGVLNTALPPLIVLILGVLAQRQRPLAAPAPLAPPLSGEAREQPAPSAAPKYAKSGLTPERMGVLAEQLAAFMAQEQAFLESDLTLDQLAARTTIPPHQLSQVFNQHLGSSFFEYINRLRVEEVKRCLADPAFANQSVLEIGLSAGFNSKAAFNAAFKRFTGTTPTLYRTATR